MTAYFLDSALVKTVRAGNWEYLDTGALGLNPGNSLIIARITWVKLRVRSPVRNEKVVPTDATLIIKGFALT